MAQAIEKPKDFNAWCMYIKQEANKVNHQLTAADIIKPFTVKTLVS